MPIGKLIKVIAINAFLIIFPFLSRIAHSSSTITTINGIKIGCER